MKKIFLRSTRIIYYNWIMCCIPLTKNVICDANQCSMPRTTPDNKQCLLFECPFYFTTQNISINDHRLQTYYGL